MAPRLAFATPVGRDTAIEQLLIVKDLIALGTGRSLTWRSLDAEFAVPIDSLGGAWATILARPTGRSCDEVLHPLEMLFTFKDIQHRFNDVLSSWLKVTNEIKPLYTLYSATTRGERLYSEHRLFNFFQALESFHRMRFELNDEIALKAEMIREKISASCSPDEKEWIKDKLQHLGQPSAAERIKMLIEQFDGKWIFEPDWEGAVKRIKGLRNYFTHFSKKPPTENLDSASIYNDGSRLQVLCEQILLVEIGFRPMEASALLQKNGRLQRLTVK